MPVLWNNHLVGRVSAVAPWTSRVVLITDPEMRVGAAVVPGLSDKVQITHRDCLGVEQVIARFGVGPVPQSEGEIQRAWAPGAADP